MLRPQHDAVFPSQTAQQQREGRQRFVFFERQLQISQLTRIGTLSYDMLFADSAELRVWGRSTQERLEGSFGIGPTLRVEPGRYAFAGLERVMHEKARLGILTSLAARHDGLVFTDLKELCQLTDGNLSRHLAVLEEAGIVELRKVGKGRRPQTLCKLTGNGRRRFVEYVQVLESVVAEAACAAGQPKVRRRVDPDGLAPA